MINTVIERLEQYWTTFCNAPVELQVVGGALGLGAIYMISGATGKLWRLLLPVRWVSAKVLTLTSMLMYRSKNAPKQKLEETPYFNTTTLPNFEKTCKYYRKGNNVEQLSDESLGILNKVRANFYNHHNDYKFLTEERQRRQDLYRLKIINEEAITTYMGKPSNDVDIKTLQDLLDRYNIQGFDNTATKSLDGPIAKSDPTKTKILKEGDKVMYKKEDHIIVDVDAQRKTRYFLCKLYGEWAGQHFWVDASQLDA